MAELTQLIELCRKLGASPLQARAMAQQLLKRADQLAIERNQTREECMTYLLRLVMQGNAGLVPPEFSSGGSESK
jgi:hypothetical protein